MNMTNSYPTTAAETLKFGAATLLEKVFVQNNPAFNRVEDMDVDVHVGHIFYDAEDRVVATRREDYSALAAVIEFADGSSVVAYWATSDGRSFSLDIKRSAAPEDYHVATLITGELVGVFAARSHEEAIDLAAAHNAWILPFEMITTRAGEEDWRSSFWERYSPLLLELIRDDEKKKERVIS